MGLCTRCKTITAGQASCQLVIKVMKGCVQGIQRCFKKCCGMCCDCCGSATIHSVWCCAVCVTGEDSTRYHGKEDVAPNQKRPEYCNGTCRGAKQARRIHRKNLRLLKRRGANTSKMVAWWEKPYTCTCVLR